MESTNPNSIGEMIGFNSGVPTSSENVYRSLATEEAVRDIYASEVVRSKSAAGLQSKYGDTVYWSKGKDGKSHIVSEGTYVIEAPHSIAAEREVRHDEVTGVYTKKDSEVFNILEDHSEESVQKRIEELRTRLGIVSKK